MAQETDIDALPQRQRQQQQQQQQQQQKVQKVEQKPSVRVKNGTQCRVQLLDGTELRVDIEKSAKGEELLDRIADHLNLKEKEYFSCYYRENNNKVWMNHDKKLSDQLKASWLVTFQVKFYPPSPSSLNDDVARYLLFLQVRSDILSDRLPCSFISEALLGSYVAQSELGDYEPEEHGHGTGYLRSLHLSSKPSEELNEKIAELHRQQRGQAPSECELRYLDNAKNLALYGVHMHPAKDKEGIDVKVGVHASGLLIYKDQLRVTRCTWPKILKISYKRSNFYIKYRPEEVDQPEKIVGFRCPSYKQAKRLWKIAVEHHAFFRLKETDPPKRNPFPPFSSKFRYSGRTMYQTRQGPHSRPGSTMDRPISRQSVPSAPNTAPTTPSSTYKPENQFRPGDGSLGRGPEQAGTGSEPGTLDSQRNRRPPGHVPVAKLDDDLGDNADAEGYEPALAARTTPAQHQGRLNGYGPLRASGGLGSIENVKPFVQEPARAKLSRGADRRMYFVNRPSNEALNDMQDGVGGDSLGRGSARPLNTPPPGSYGSQSSMNRGGGAQPGTPGVGGRPGSAGGLRGGSTSPDHTQPIVTKNVFITAKLNPGGKGTQDGGHDGLPPDQKDLLRQARLRGQGGAEGSWETPGYSGPLTTHTYTAPDGTVITEYKNEKDGVIETRIEKRLVVSGDDTADHDRALAEAIRAVTDINPDLCVEKIEIQTKTEGDI